MDLGVFETILASIPKGSVVSLQGEGEPLLWPHFEDVLQKYGEDYKFETITNGTLIKDLSSLYRLGISIDTLAPKIADQNGRPNHEKVIRTALYYRNTLNCTIRVMTVDYGQDLEPLKKWCEFFGMEHVIQPLQPKEDYVKFYPSKKLVPEPVTVKPKLYTCGAGFTGKPTYWNVDGVALPCCFTKDLTEFFDCANVQNRLRIGVEPLTCKGCQYLNPVQ